MNRKLITFFVKLSILGVFTLSATPSEIEGLDPAFIVSQVEIPVTAESQGIPEQSISGCLSIRKTLIIAQTGRSSMAFLDELIERDIYGNVCALRTTWAVGDELIIRLEPGVSIVTKLVSFDLELRQTLGDHTYVVALGSVSSATALEATRDQLLASGGVAGAQLNYLYFLGDFSISPNLQSLSPCYYRPDLGKSWRNGWMGLVNDVHHPYIFIERVGWTKIHTVGQNCPQPRLLYFWVPSDNPDGDWFMSHAEIWPFAWSLTDEVWVQF